MGKGIKVEFDDDGSAYVDDAVMNGVLQPYAQRINELQQALINSNNQNNVKSSNQSKLDSILNEKEGYVKAENTLSRARTWIDNTLRDIQEDQGLTGTIGQTEALDFLRGTAVEKEFNKEFAGVDLMDAIFGYNSNTQLKAALDNVINNTEKVEAEELQTTTIEGGLESGRITTEDIMNLNDEQADALLRKMK
jgi:hypothetical protein